MRAMHVRTRVLTVHTMRQTTANPEMAPFRPEDETGGILTAIVDASDDAIISKDLDGVIRSWNRAAERLYGYTAEEVTGRPVSLILPH